MKRARVLTIGAALVVVTLRLTAGTQSTASSSSLAGSVTNSDNVPVACARVVLQGGGQVLSTRTGADGRFVFAKVPFRAHWIGVEPDVNRIIDDRAFPDPMNMTLHANHGVLLAGVLLDEHHQPAKNVEVTALLRRHEYGRPRFVPVANDVTEADGSYCIQVPRERGNTLTSRGVAQSPTATGEFLVGVIPTGTWLKHPGWAANIASLAGHPPTYFPSVVTSAAATVLAVRDGERRRGVNFSIQTGRVTRIEGLVLDPDVLTLSASDVVLEPPDEDVAIHRRATPDAKGYFVFSDVPAGEYTVRVFPPSRPEGAGRWGAGRVTVRGQPYVRVTVETTPTQTFSGDAVFSGQPMMLPGVSTFFTVNAVRVADVSNRFPSSFYPSAFSSSDGHGHFAIKNLMPGQYGLTVSGSDWRGWRLDAIKVPLVGEDGRVEWRDVTKTPLLVEAGRDTFNARVELSPEVPGIAGIVRDDDGKPVSAHVIVYPANREQWSAGPRTLSSPAGIADTQAHADGAFTIVDLPVGEYLAVAVEGSPRIDAGLLAALEIFATRVTVGKPPAAVHITLTRVLWPRREATVGPAAWSKR